MTEFFWISKLIRPVGHEKLGGDVVFTGAGVGGAAVGAAVATRSTEDRWKFRKLSIRKIAVSIKLNDGILPRDVVRSHFTMTAINFMISRSQEEEEDLLQSSDVSMQL